jgi:hypothetical protein
MGNASTVHNSTSANMGQNPTIACQLRVCAYIITCHNCCMCNCSPLIQCWIMIHDHPKHNPVHPLQTRKPPNQTSKIPLD